MNLIIGANGLIGGCLARKLSQAQQDWMGTYFHRPLEQCVKLDITDKRNVEAIVKTYNPSVVYFCANLAGGVNFCENNPDKARAFHVEGIKNIGQQCIKSNAKFVFISSDYIFSDKEYPVKEDEKPSPLNIYGELKLEAEQWIVKNIPKHVIIRTTNVYGWDPLTVTPNYMMNLYRTISEGKEFNAPSFLWGNPTYVGDIVNVLVKLVQDEISGTFHVVGLDYVNRYNWAMRACDILGLNKEFVQEVKDIPEKIVPRPMRLSLNTEKILNLYPDLIHGLDDGLSLMKNEMD